MKKRDIYEILCWGVILVTAMAMAVLGSTENLWYDEAYTVAMIQHPVREIVEITSYDVHSPFYYILVKGFYLLCGQRIQAVKMFSVLFLVLFEVVIKYAVSAIWDKRAALYSLLLVLALPSVAVQAVNCRMYTMGLFFVGLSVALSYFAVCKSEVRLWCLFTLSCVAAMYVHIFTMISMFFLFLILFVFVLCDREHRRKNIMCYLGSGIVSSIAYLPWLRVILRQFGTVKETSMYADITQKSYVGYCVEWFSSEWHTGWRTLRAWQAALLLAVVLYVVIILFLKAKHKVLPGILLLLAVLPTIFGIVFSLNVTTVYTGRYSFPLLGLICVFMGVAFSSVRFKVLPICVMALLLAGGVKNYGEEYSRQTDKGMQEFLVFAKETVGEKDAYMVDSIHASLFLLYEGNHPYYMAGTVADMNPFAVKDFVDWEDLGDVEHIYLLALSEEPLNIWPFADYPSRLVKEFDYMMYHVKIHEIDYMGGK